MSERSSDSNARNRARRDHSLWATVLSRRPLRFAGGPDAAQDRPAHVRAGSGLAAADGRLVVVQDDANFLALIDPGRPESARAIALPRGEDGARQFGDSRGNKHLKLDLEACVGTPDGSFVAFGSGSTPRREVALVADALASDEPRIRVVALPALYAALRDASDFAGSELNVEGAVLIGERLRLFARGNGAARDGLAPVNASCELAWPRVLRHLEDPDHAAPPRPERVRPFRLGDLDGVSLGFTDATSWGDHLLFTAAAEDSPDAVRDGKVTGSVIGVIGDVTRWAPLLDDSGRLLREKVEGILVADADAGELWVVADADDEHRASELWRVRLGGPWRGGALSAEA